MVAVACDTLDEMNIFVARNSFESAGRTRLSGKSEFRAVDVPMRVPSLIAEEKVFEHPRREPMPEST
jgi:hypothetical protein